MGLRKKLLLTITLLFSIAGHTQFLDGSIELKYLQGDFQGILDDALEKGAIARYAKRSVINKKAVTDLLTITYIGKTSEYFPNYDITKVQIGRETDGQISFEADYYNMAFGQVGLYQIMETYLLALDAYNLFNWETALEMEVMKQFTYCNGVKEDIDQPLKVDAFKGTIRFDSWRSMIESKWDCKDVKLFYSRFWDESMMFLKYSNDIYNVSIPQHLKTQYWYETVEYHRESPPINGGQIQFSYRIEENLLAEILGFEDELYETVSLESTSTDQFYITPKINGVNEYKMLFDTGASICTMSDSHQETFLMLGLVKETGQTIELVNADGVKSVKNIYICDMTIGAKNIEGIQIVFTSGTPLFGMNVLNQMDDWRIDGDNLIFKK